MIAASSLGFPGRVDISQLATVVALISGLTRMWALGSGNGRACPRNFAINLALTSTPHDGDDVTAGKRALIAKHDVGWRVEFNAIARGKFVARRAFHDGEAVA